MEIKNDELGLEMVSWIGDTYGNISGSATNYCGLQNIEDAYKTIWLWINNRSLKVFKYNHPNKNIPIFYFYLYSKCWELKKKKI